MLNYGTYIHVFLIDILLSSKRNKHMMILKNELPRKPEETLVNFKELENSRNNPTPSHLTL